MTRCIIHVSSFCPTCICQTGLILDNLIICLYHGALASWLPCATSLSQGESSSWVCTFQTHNYQSRVHTPNYFPYWAFILSVTETCFNHPGPGTRQLGTDFMPQGLTLANSKLAYPALPTSSHGNHSNGSCPVSPFHLPHDQPRGLPHVTPPLRHGMPFHLENCE